MFLASTVAAAAPRELRPEQLLLMDGSEPASIHVAAARATTLVFDAAPAKGGVRLDGTAPVPLVVSGSSVTVVPERELLAQDGALLTVELADGARVRFALLSVPDDVDGEVRVLRGSASDQLRARLERCERQITTGDVMARYLLEPQPQFAAHVVTFVPVPLHCEVPP